MDITLLPDELLIRMIVDRVDFNDVCSLRKVSTPLRSCMIRLEHEIAQQYAIHVLKDANFWSLAQSRPRITSNPLNSWHREMVRLHTFRSVFPASANELYSLWKVLDGACDCY